mgnify:CR=1 FL=1
MQNSGLHLRDYHSDVTKQHQKFSIKNTIPQCLKLELVCQPCAVIHIKGFLNSMTRCACISRKFGLTWLPLVLKEIILNSEHCGIPQCVHIDGIQSMLLALYSNVHSKVTVAAA